MLSSKTVLVVGAGASAEVGLPIGIELREKIAKKLDFRKDDFGRADARHGDRTILDTLRRRNPQNVNEYIDACTKISRGIVLFSSIDNFIDTHKHDEFITKVGKISIARSILEAENGSKLYINPSNSYNELNFSDISQTWHVNFFEWLTNGVDKSNLESIFDNLTIISFNYDRCIQHFLVHAVSRSFLIKIDQAKKIVRKLRIFFPYGSVGTYLSESEMNIPFGEENIPEFDRIFSGLKTYTERIEDSAALEEMRSAVAEANPIIFLGNNYHDTNINLLCGGQPSKSEIKIIYGTKKGIESESDLGIVKTKLQKLNPPTGSVAFNFSETCSDLFRQFGRSMRGN